MYGFPNVHRKRLNIFEYMRIPIADLTVFGLCPFLFRFRFVLKLATWVFVFSSFFSVAVDILCRKKTWQLFLAHKLCQPILSKRVDNFKTNSSVDKYTLYSAIKPMNWKYFLELEKMYYWETSDFTTKKMWKIGPNRSCDVSVAICIHLNSLFHSDKASKLLQ